MKIKQKKLNKRRLKYLEKSQKEKTQLMKIFKTLPLTTVSKGEFIKYPKNQQFLNYI